MSTGEIPVVLLLLLPGFLAVQVFNWVSHKRRLSDLETLLWVLLSAFALLAPTTIVWHALDDAVPSLSELVKNPTTLPMRVALVSYIVAVPSGWLAGQLDLSRRLEDWSLKVKVDLKRRHDVWYLAFRDAYYVIAYLRGGVIMYGWPEMTTTNRDGSAAEVFLTHTLVWDSEAQKWVGQEAATGVWLDASSIERIDFTARPEDEALLEAED